MTTLPAEAPPGRLRALRDSFSGLGLLIGALLLAASLTPSLIPRAPALQGVLAGSCMAIGYLLGVLAEGTWRFLGLRAPRASMRRFANRTAAGAAAAVVVSCLWQAAAWQNSIRLRMDMAPVASSEPWSLARWRQVCFWCCCSSGGPSPRWRSSPKPARRA